MELHLDVHVLSVLAGVAIPLLVGLLTKVSASRRVKSIANVVLSIAAGAIAAALEAHGDITVNVLLTWITSVATYYGLWKPTGIAPAVQEKTANVGIG